MNRFPIILMAMTAASYSSAETFNTVSPDGSLSVNISYDDDHRLYYEVEKAGDVIVAKSALGLRISSLSLQSFAAGVETDADTIDESYALPHGKTLSHRNHCNEILIEGKNANASRNLKVRFRVYDDAVAFRYEIDNRTGSVITADLSEFIIENFNSSHAQTYHKDYSWYYDKRSWDETAKETAYNTPLLLECGNDNYILLTEAAATSSMAACKVIPGKKEGQFLLSPAGNSEINSDSFQSPWRTMIIGSLNDIVESNRIPDLNPATAQYDFSWVKPGRVAWNWGAEDGDGHPTYEQACRYIDMTNYLGWEYFLLDDGWKNNLDLSTIIDYADNHGVGLLIWANQSDFENDYDFILAKFSEWSDLGVKGVKIDFFEDDSQKMLSKYEKMLKAAAETRLMVNFHGCTKPSGMEREWPNLMTSEAVLGGEFYMFNSTMTPGSHTVNLALTRNVLGSMDYTPVKFGSKTGRVITDTSWAYQMALSLAFESSLQCFCDTPENIIGSVAEPFFRLLPTAWDEIRCLEAEPDEFVSLARRKGDTWWVAAITDKERQADIPLSFLDPTKIYHAYIYSEGFCRSDIAFEKREVTADDVVSLSLGDNSGAAMILSECDDLLSPHSLKFEAEMNNHLGQRGTDQRCSGGAFVQGLNGTRKYLDFASVDVPEDGAYDLTMFYLQKGEHDAYICVNNGEKVYYTFPDTDNRLFFKTVKVNLNKGVNSITIGNENGTAPGFDRIVVNGFFGKAGISDGVKGVCNENPDESPVTIKDKIIYVSDGSNALIRILTPDGKCVAATTGDSLPIPDSKGIYIIQVITNNYMFNHKIFN